MATQLQTRTEQALQLQAIDHLEFWVGNALPAARFYCDSFGFQVIAYAGPETGVRDRASYAVRQGDVVFVLTAGLAPDSPIVRHAARHGDCVRDIALRVPNVDEAFAYTTGRGATPVERPTTIEGQKGRIRRASIATYGDTVHSFVDRSDYAGAFYPLYHRVGDSHAEPSHRHSERSDESRRGAVGIQRIDHVVGNVELGQMDRWAAFYRDAMGFSQLGHFTDQAISTEYTALMSKVMQDGSGRIKFPINEPAPGRKKSQIDEFLQFYGGPGVQHIALHTDDIIRTVTTLRERGVKFLRVPDTYYTALDDRADGIEEDFAAIKRLNILVDRDDEGYLLQIFTKPLQDRPTLFLEIIQRHGATGFGVGNFKALFEAIEAEQTRRGNL